MLYAVQGRKPEREEFSSVSVSGEKNRRSSGKAVLRLVQHNLSLMELICLDSGPHKPSHTAPGSLRHRQGEAVLLTMHHTGRCPEQWACLQEAKLSLWFPSIPSTRSSPITTPMFLPGSSWRGSGGNCKWALPFPPSPHRGLVYDPLQHVISHVAP